MLGGIRCCLIPCGTVSKALTQAARSLESPAFGAGLVQSRRAIAGAWFDGGYVERTSVTRYS